MENRRNTDIESLESITKVSVNIVEAWFSMSDEKKLELNELQKLIFSLDTLCGEDNEDIEIKISNITKRLRDFDLIGSKLEMQRIIIWQELESVFSDEEKDNIAKTPYETIKAEREELILRLKAIAIEVLQMVQEKM
ncbi:hypothetical protein J7J83_01975 [bacterium]|nr:hypothetical protein [bacterium]